MNKIKLPLDVEFYEDIRNFEQYLTGNGVVVRKFFLLRTRIDVTLELSKQSRQPLRSSRLLR